jgi:hypothetical protein
MSRLDPIWRGVAEAAAALVACAAAFTLETRLIPAPSPQLLLAIASLGTALLLAYVVEMAWLITRLRSASDYELRLGAFVGLGIGGLIGVVLALLLSAHNAAGHSNFLDDVGLAWVVSSLAVLGSLVVVQPLLVHEWAVSNESD